MFITLDAIPVDELSYLPNLCTEPRDRLLKVACDFLEALGTRKATIEGLNEHLFDLQEVNVLRQEAEALAIAAYEHASARGLTAAQRGMWLFNLMLLGCDPEPVKVALKLGHDLYGLGLGGTPDLLARIVAEHFSNEYLHLT